MGFRQVFLIAIAVGAVAVIAQQPLPPHHGLYPPRSPNTLGGIGKQMTDFALNRFISAVRGGGRGHRELMALTSGSSPYSTIRLAPPPQYSFGRVPPSITHIPPAPKLGAFYITPPERDAPFYYGGPAGPKRPHMYKLTELKYGRPLTLLASETSNRPGGPRPLQLINYSGPTQLASAATDNPQQQQQLQQQLQQRQQIQQQQQQQQQQIQQQQQQQQQVEGSSSNSAQSLQEIIAKAAQEQHAKVLQKEQKAHPDAQITNSQIILPGPNGPQQLSGPIQGVQGGRQPIFVNQFGQQFLAPAIFGAQGQQQQFPQGLPPQFIQALQAQGGPSPQQIQYIPSPQQGGGQGPGPQIQYIQANGGGEGIPPQFQLQQQQGPQQFLRQRPGGPQQGGQVLISPQGIPLSSFQGIPPQAAGQLFGIQGGQLSPAQFGLLSQQGAHLAGLGGQIVNGNAILGSPHFALVGGNLQQQQVLAQQTRGGNHHQQQQQQQQQQAQKEEQPTRPQESASEVHSVSTPLDNDGSQFQAAIMESQAEFSEPITKL